MAGSWAVTAWSIYGFGILGALGCRGAQASKPLQTAQPTEPAAGLAMPDAHLVTGPGAPEDAPLVFTAPKGSPCGKDLVCIVADRIVFAEPLEFEPELAVPVRRANLIFAAVTELLEAHPELKRVLVAGYFAGRDTEEENQDVSERRAKRVRAELTLRGVSKSRLGSHGFGSAQPLVEGKTPEASARNSRVELIIVEKAQ